MAEREYPVRVAGITFVSTLGAATLMVWQWVMPTVTASLNHEITILKEKNLKLVEEIAELKRSSEHLSQKYADDKKLFLQKNASRASEINELKQQLFSSQKLNTFLIGNPYPIGFDKIKIGDLKDKIFDIYPRQSVQESGKTAMLVNGSGGLFRWIQYNHSNDKSTRGKIDSIKFHLDKSLPGLPDNWLEEILTKALGRPYLVGSDEECLFWKKTEDEAVYYKKATDWFEVNGMVTYPAGCYVTDEQLSKMKRR